MSQHVHRALQSLRALLFLCQMKLQLLERRCRRQGTSQSLSPPQISLSHIELSQGQRRSLEIGKGLPALLQESMQSWASNVVGDGLVLSLLMHQGQRGDALRVSCQVLRGPPGVVSGLTP